MTARVLSELNAGGFGDLARPDTAGADLDVLRAAVHHRAHSLDVGFPSPLGQVVSVGDVVSGHRAFAADFTSLRHTESPPRGPRTGVELHTTGGSVFQVRTSLLHPYFCHQKLRRAHSEAK